MITVGTKVNWTRGKHIFCGTVNKIYVEADMNSFNPLDDPKIRRMKVFLIKRDDGIEFLKKENQVHIVL